ncbi:19613_t:CDS:2, partial [Gigaspora rosea]
MDKSINNTPSKAPAGDPATKADPAKIDPNIKAYIDEACQGSTNAIISSLKAYIDQSTAIQMDLIKKLNERLDSGSNQKQYSSSYTSTAHQEFYDNRDIAQHSNPYQRPAYHTRPQSQNGDAQLSTPEQAKQRHTKRPSKRASTPPTYRISDNQNQSYVAK